jgi:hypothetical protein
MSSRRTFGIFGTNPNGELCRSRGRSFLRSFSISFSVNPVPTLPTYLRPLSPLTARTSEPSVADRRPFPRV